MPENIVPNPIPLNFSCNNNDRIPPINTFDVSKAVFILPNSIFVTLLTAKDTPSPGNIIAFDKISKYTPIPITKQLIIHNIHFQK